MGASFRRACSRAGLAVAALCLLLAVSWMTAPAAAHEGCGQHSPLAQARLQALDKHLRQLRATEAAANHRRRLRQASIGGNSSSSSSSSSASSTSHGRQVVAAELRVGAVYNLKGVGTREAAIIEKQLVPAAIRVLQRYLKVLRPEGPPRVSSAFYSDNSQGGCIISKASPALAAAVKKYDLSLYITADATGCLPGMIAVATACDVDPATKRPVLGTLNICPASLKGLEAPVPRGSEARAAAVGRLVEVLVHEVIHVLGFGANHYEDWRDAATGRVWGRDAVVTWHGGRPFLSTPKSRQVAREYFGCATLPGVPLEDEGASFSALSHFEYRLLQRELMTAARPIDRSRSRLSAFTLAALEDSGWYVADYADAEPLDWGRGAGCDFVLASCWDYMSRAAEQPYFCGRGTLNQTRCTAHGSGWGVCRSSAFTDGCLLVGKYSSDAAALPREDGPPSAADGRAAACYSPPQLAALQRGASGGEQGAAGGSLLLLLGGSYSAASNDICYNLIAEPAGSGGDGRGVDPACVIPEDCPGGVPKPGAPGAPGAPGSGGSGKPGGGSSAAVRNEAGASSQGRQPLATVRDLERLSNHAVLFKFFEYDAVHGSSHVRLLEAGSKADTSRVAACVNMDRGTGGGGGGGSSGGSSGSSSASSSNSSGGSQSGAGRRRLLGALLTSAARSWGQVVQLVGTTVAAGAGGEQHHGSSTAPHRQLAAAAPPSPPPPAQPPLTSPPAPAPARGGAAPSKAAACMSSPVLCFRSSCDASGRLTIEAQLPAAAGGASSVRFACPSGRTVDLSSALPGRYLLGFLRCPSNQLVCESMGCGECSPSGGVCSRGKCHCHMERLGPACRDSLVPDAR